MQMRVGLLQMADCGPRKEDLQAKGEASCRQAAGGFSFGQQVFFAGTTVGHL